MLYTRIGDGGFDNRVPVAENRIKLYQQPGKIYSYKVTALNRGGEVSRPKSFRPAEFPTRKGRCWSSTDSTGSARRTVSYATRWPVFTMKSTRRARWAGHQLYRQPVRIPSSGAVCRRRCRRFRGQSRGLRERGHRRQYVRLSGPARPLDRQRRIFVRVVQQRIGHRRQGEPRRLPSGRSDPRQAARNRPGARSLSAGIPGFPARTATGPRGLLQRRGQPAGQRRLRGFRPVGKATRPGHRRNSPPTR